MKKFYLVRYEVNAPEDSLATRMLEDKEFETKKDAYNFFLGKLQEQCINEEKHVEGSSCEK